MINGNFVKTKADLEQPFDFDQTEHCMKVVLRQMQKDFLIVTQVE